MENKLKFLSQINLLEEMQMDELKEIDRISNMKPLKKGTTIFTPDTSIQALYLLKKGQVRLYRMSENGKQFTVDILGDGNIFGETSTFSLTEDQDYAEAMSDVYLCIIGKSEFENLIEQNPKLAIKLIEILSARLRDIYEVSDKLL
ncbi:Crp/Fnr family transcriptional regulator [Pseudalkalibacillus sp. A8]|uniref:Crp/Fnr family transcriptional regulator n=1 Tax=Pseudalkalibacillus sp. A8 TaxID=3382641 RepID=UPI0038B463A0